MATLVNGKPIRERGGNKHRFSRKDFERKSHTATAAIVQDAVYWECAEVKETIETHLVPRKSLTASQGLNLFEPDREYEPVATKELNHRTGKVETVYGDRRVIWTQDRSLLKRGLPDAFGEGKKGSEFTRVTSQTKRRQFEPEYKDTPQDSQPVINDPTELPFALKTISATLPTK